MKAFKPLLQLKHPFDRVISHMVLETHMRNTGEISIETPAQINGSSISYILYVLMTSSYKQWICKQYNGSIILYDHEYVSAIQQDEIISNNVDIDKLPTVSYNNLHRLCLYDSEYQGRLYPLREYIDQLIHDIKPFIHKGVNLKCQQYTDISFVYRLSK